MGVMFNTYRHELVAVWFPFNHKDFVSVRLLCCYFGSFVLLIKSLSIKYMDVVVITHVSSSDIPPICAPCKCRHWSTSLGKGHEVLPLSIFSIPDENHWFKTHLSRSNHTSIRCDWKSHDVIWMTKLTLCCLLTLLHLFLTSSKEFLCSCLRVKDDT